MKSLQDMLLLKNELVAEAQRILDGAEGGSLNKAQEIDFNALTKRLEKEKGMVALNSAMSFLGVRRELEKIQQDSLSGIGKCDHSLARVESISRRYHEVGTATRNFGRALTGKEARDDTKDSGKLAKLAAAPYQTMKTLYTGMEKAAGAVLGKLDKLEQAAKPSMLENLQTLKETAAREQGMALSPPKSKEPSL